MKEIKQHDRPSQENIPKRVRRVELVLLMTALSHITYISAAVWNDWSNRSQIEKVFPENDDNLMHSATRDKHDMLSSLGSIQEEMALKKEPYITFSEHDNQRDILSLSAIQDALASIKELQDNIASLRANQLELSKSLESIVEGTKKETVIKSSSQPNEVKFDNGVEKRPQKKKTVPSKRQQKRKRILQNEKPELSAQSCSTFRVEIELDIYGEETYWTLISESDNVVLQNVSYSEDDSLEEVSFETCLEPGPYTFTLFDKWSDGIDCLSGEEKPCFRIYVNDEVFEGQPFASAISVFFDSASKCIFDSLLSLQLRFDPDNEDFNMLLLDDLAESSVTLEHAVDESGNGTEVYFACIEPGIYHIDFFVSKPIISCENECYVMTVGDNPEYIGGNHLVTSSFPFYLSIEGNSRERKCAALPIISPSNEISSFEFDPFVANNLDVIHALSSIEAIHRKGTHQYQAACFILFDDALQIGAEDPGLAQRYVLSLLLYATNQYPEVDLPLDTCENLYVECDDFGRIETINMGFQGLDGSIPTEIAHFSSLVSLEFEENFIQGTLPTELGLLSKLELFSINENQLTGTIPTWLGLLSRCRVLAMNENNLEGTIPKQIGNLSELEELRLAANNFIGSIPTELMKATKLVTLFLERNKLTGTIPTQIGLLSQLEAFVSENNLHTGTLPTAMQNLRRIGVLKLGFNQFTGTIPNGFNNILPFIDFRLNDNEFMGTIPQLKVSEEFYLQNNNLEGTISDSLWDLNITGLRLEGNNLQGSISEEFCSTLTPVKGFPDGFYDLTVDDSPWFLDEPLVSCPCCDDVNCHMWRAEDRIVGGTVRPSCPTSNIVSFTVLELYLITDNATQLKKGEGFGNEKKTEFHLCLSPTGCFDVQRGRELEESFQLGYSESSRSLIKQESCDAVNICGTLIDVTDPRRAQLNHLTQIAFPDLSVLNDSSSNEYKAMCWLMTQDKILHKFNVCDGTLLQRFVMSMFFFSQQHVLEIDVLSSQHTCDWDGVYCDPKEKFIEHLKYSGRELRGTLITEIGFLTRLNSLDLSDNAFTGAIEPSIFKHLPHLEVFNVRENKFEHKLPKEILVLPKLKELNIAHNLFVGKLPNSVHFSTSLESFDCENNLLTGEIPSALTACPRLREMNLSRNNIQGTIPPEIGDLIDLKDLKLNQNSLSGSLPIGLFDSKSIEIFQVQSNALTGSIPVSIGKMTNATIVTMNHNFFKGEIPKEFESLTRIERLQLHRNSLTGTAPSMPHLRELGLGSGNDEIDRYMTDCGAPFFALPDELECTTCTACCNSEKHCQKNRIWPVDIRIIGFVAIYSLPLMLGLYYALRYFTMRRCGAKDHRDPLGIYSTDSIYCMIFAGDKTATLVYAVTYVLQSSFYAIFLSASAFNSDSSDWQFTLRCPSTRDDCDDENETDTAGWFLFYVVTLSYLSIDFGNSALQIRKGIYTSDFRLFISGVLYLGVTSLALFASVCYNIATATKNTELLLNAVILLFINDLDEHFMDVMKTGFPNWTCARLEEINSHLETKVDDHKPDYASVSVYLSTKVDEMKSSGFSKRFSSRDVDFSTLEFWSGRNRKSSREEFSDNSDIETANYIETSKPGKEYDKKIQKKKSLSFSEKDIFEEVEVEDDKDSEFSKADDTAGERFWRKRSVRFSQENIFEHDDIEDGIDSESFQSQDNFYDSFHKEESLGDKQKSIVEEADMIDTKHEGAPERDDSIEDRFEVEKVTRMDQGNILEKAEIDTAESREVSKTHNVVFESFQNEKSTTKDQGYIFENAVVDAVKYDEISEPDDGIDESFEKWETIRSNHEANFDEANLELAKYDRRPDQGENVDRNFQAQKPKLAKQDLISRETEIEMRKDRELLKRRVSPVHTSEEEKYVGQKQDHLLEEAARGYTDPEDHCRENVQEEKSKGFEHSGEANIEVASFVECCDPKSPITSGQEFSNNRYELRAEEMNREHLSKKAHVDIAKERSYTNSIASKECSSPLD